MLVSETFGFKKLVLFRRSCVYMLNVTFVVKKSGDAYFSKLKLQFWMPLVQHIFYVNGNCNTLTTSSACHMVY